MNLKKSWKRILSIFCAVVLLLAGYAGRSAFLRGPSVEAQEKSPSAGGLMRVTLSGEKEIENNASYEGTLLLRVSAEGEYKLDIQKSVTGKADEFFSYTDADRGYGIFRLQPGEQDTVYQCTLTCGGETKRYMFTLTGRGEGQQTVEPEETEKPEETKVPDVTETPAEAETPQATEIPAVETEKPPVTEAPVETEKPVKTEKPAGTEEPGETEKPEVPYEITGQGGEKGNYSSTVSITAADGYDLEITGDAAEDTVREEDGRFTIAQLYSDETYCVTCWHKDGSGEKQTILVRGKEITEEVELTLKEGKTYHLGSGRWKLDGEDTVYEGNQTFSVLKDGKYAFISEE